MEYTIRAKDEFNAEAHRHLYGDFSWMRNVDPSLFFDKEVAAKVLRWANADSESDAYLIKYLPQSLFLWDLGFRTTSARLKSKSLRKK